jgi:hypothetical protein
MQRKVNKISNARRSSPGCKTEIQERMTIYQPRRSSPQSSTTFTDQETEALNLMLEHMGHEVLARGEADPEKSGEEIINEARQQTLAWLNSPSR